MYAKLKQQKRAKENYREVTSHYTYYVHCGQSFHVEYLSLEDNKITCRDCSKYAKKGGQQP